MRDSTYMIDLNVVTFDAFCKLDALDETFIGTPDYMGVAYFWGHGVKHYLREASQAQRRRIHKKWLEQGNGANIKEKNKINKKSLKSKNPKKKNSKNKEHLVLETDSTVEVAVDGANELLSNIVT